MKRTPQFHNNSDQDPTKIFETEDYPDPKKKVKRLYFND